MAKSILQEEKECFLCHTTLYLEEHHVMNGANRRLADKDGLTVYLCWNCHDRIHLNVNERLRLKRDGQIIWQSYYNKTEEDFIRRYGKSYLWVENTQDAQIEP